MKKILAMIMSAAMTAAVFTGCGKAVEKPADNGEADVTNAAVSEVTFPEIAIADNAVDYAKSMKLGWNLGNTLDAVTSSSLDSETMWGQPKTTKELIQFVKDSGFTTIRIPVSWGQHTTDENYTIDPAWMARVNEVVDYAVESGLYIILNSHHDCDYYYPTEEKFAEGEKYLKSIWTQISENFKDYDERLIFESMNEPRLTGTNKEWWFQDNDAEGVASIKTIVKYNQIFVDTVRAGEGYNKTRFLMVPSNAAAPQNALNAAFEMPVDTAENRLMVSVHAYSPYDFAMNDKGYKVWDGSKSGELNFMDNLSKKFIENGYGVVIGEFGATNKDNLEDRVAWAKDYCGKAASLGIPCVLWDNGGTKVGSENFGMIYRIPKTIHYPELLDAMLEAYK